MPQAHKFLQGIALCKSYYLINTFKSALKAHLFNLYQSAQSGQQEVNALWNGWKMVPSLTAVPFSFQTQWVCSRAENSAMYKSNHQHHHHSFSLFKGTSSLHIFVKMNASSKITSTPPPPSLLQPFCPDNKLLIHLLFRLLCKWMTQQKTKQNKTCLFYICFVLILRLFPQHKQISTFAEDCLCPWKWQDRH